MYRTLVFGEDYSAPATEEILYTALLTAITTGVVEGGDIAAYGKNINALLEQSKEQIKEDGEKDLQSREMPDDAHLEIMELNDSEARGMIAIYEMVNMEDAESNIAWDTEQTDKQYLAENLLDELSHSNLKHTPEDVVAILKTKENKLVWLEQGSATAGLVHIMSHAEQFADKGISQDKIVDFLMTAIKEGEIVGTQRTRAIYEVMYEGKLHRVAISISSNGFIVGANPKSIPGEEKK